MINGLVSVSRTYNGLLVPIAKYTLTNFLKVNVPKIATSMDFAGKPVVDDLQVDVYKTTPAIENVTAIFDNKIITAMVRYDSFIVNCHAETREDAKTWMDGFEHQMIKKNQYRGKCLYAEKDNIFFRDVPKVSWEDVILAEKIKKDIRLNTVEFLGNVKFAAAGIMKRGLVMYGPPGTGKTSVVKSIFKELEGKGVSRIYVTAESFRYMAVSRLFEFLAYLGPSVLAFEDIDMISGNRDIHTASNQLGDLLTNLDGMRKHGEPLVVIASTNKMGLLDEALANRPCRFDRRIELGLPDSIHLKAMYLKFLGQDVSDDIIHLSTSFTGSHVVETVNTAKILGANEGKSAFDCLRDACIIIRENFFPGEDMMPVKAAIQSHLIKTGSILKTASTSKTKRIANEILKEATEDFELKQYEDAVVAGILKGLGASIKKHLGITAESVRKDINNEKIRLKMHLEDYFQEDQSVEKAIKGLLGELLKQYRATAVAM